VSVRTDSVAEFICSARAIAQQGVFTMATLDFDHLTHFVKRYGPLVVSHAVQESRAQIAEALDRLVKGSYALLFSSGDEIVLVHSCSDQESICRALDEARQAVISVSRRFFPDPEDRPFCFTAVICSSELLCEDLSADAKLRTLSVASEHAMDDLKRSGQRGVTSSLKTVAERNEAEYARRVALAESIWHTASPVAVDARRLAPHVLSIPCFWSAVRSHKGDSTLALIRPLYEGSLWQSAKEWLDGGVEVLPDGKTAGKQGFLNRLVGHLTTSLLSEIVGLRVMQAIQRSHLDESNVQGARFTRQSSSLYLWWPRAVLVDGRVDWLADCLDQVRIELDSMFGPELRLCVFQIGILLGGPRLMECADALAHRVFQVSPGCLEQSSGLICYWYTDSEAAALADLVERRLRGAVRSAAAYASKAHHKE
jgi:hypothetical protein